MTLVAPEPDDAFYSATAEERRSLESLVNSGRAMRERGGGIPDASSRAMADIAYSQPFAGEWGDDPVGVAQSLAGGLMVAAEDHALALVRLTSSDPPVFYSHAVLARAAIENLGRSYTLCDINISVRQRIARGQNERLHSLEQLSNIPGLGGDDYRKERRAAIYRGADAAGLERATNDDGVKTQWILENRIGPTASVRGMFDRPGTEDLGQIVYVYYSMFTHGTAAALTESLEPQIDALGGAAAAVLTIKPESVNVAISMVRLAYLYTMEIYSEYFGWPKTEWREVAINTLKNVRERLDPNAAS